MFENNNILAFLFSILPALIYGYIIYLRAPKNAINLNKLWVYTIIGFLSITFFNFFVFIFPNFQIPVLRDFVGVFIKGDTAYNVYRENFISTLIFALIQVALLEEFSKWIAFKSGDLIRGKNALRDHPYAIMFYTTMVAAGFACIENTEYASRALRGRFGADVSAEYVLLFRSFTAVILHMVCGLIMGYYIALASKSNKNERLKYTLIGIASATILHGLYDFALMYEPLLKFKAKFLGFDFQIPSTAVVVSGLVLTYFMATDLKFRKIYRKKIKR